MIFAHALQPGLATAKENWHTMTPRKLCALDGLLLNAFYFTIHYLAAGTLRLPLAYAKLLLLMNGAWLLIAIVEHKFTVGQVRSFADILLKLVRITLLMLFTITFTLVVLGLRDFHRAYIIGTFGLLLAAEVIAAGIWYPRINRHLQQSPAKSAASRPLALAIAIADLEIYLAMYLLVHYYKYNAIVPDSRGWQIVGIMLGFWLLSAEWTGKFENQRHRNFFYAYEPFLKAAFIMASAATLLVFAFELFQYSRTLLLAPVLLLMLGEALVALIWVRIRSDSPEPEDIEEVAEVNRFLSEEALDVTPVADFRESARALLQKHPLTGSNGLFSLIEGHTDLDKIEVSALSVLDTSTPFNVEIIGSQSLQMFINLHRVNDFRRINHYFLTVHTKLMHGGYFVGVKEVSEARLLHLQKKYPKYMAHGIYFLDFLFRRVMPKLPGLARIYFVLSRGRGRAITQTELLGRLYFCGFRVIATHKSDEHFYFIAQKDKAPSENVDPTYGPLVRLKRVGYKGEIFNLYKLRTMHPYSEFIQNYVYARSNLDESGKFKDDFRVTSWGRVLRKFWLDELPQLINWVRGDVKIVGARALSEHYFSLYPRDLRKLRIQFKPGLIPPYYADLPRTLKEIQESERRYFERKQEHPIRADWEYFFKAMHNILIKRARSK